VNAERFKFQGARNTMKCGQLKRRCAAGLEPGSLILSTSHCGRAATKGSGSFRTAERARPHDRFNHFEMNNGRLGNRPSVSRQNLRRIARCVEILAHRGSRNQSAARGVAITVNPLAEGPALSGPQQFVFSHGGGRHGGRPSSAFKIRKIVANRHGPDPVSTRS
jgi:hypothetical protein